jgi:hypothetical protein
LKIAHYDFKKLGKEGTLRVNPLSKLIETGTVKLKQSFTV